MNYVFIKNKTAINIAVFESKEQAETLKEVFIRDSFIDDMVLLENDSPFGIGDKYESGEWTKIEQPPIEPLQEPTVEDYLIELDFRVSKIELGLEV